LCATPRRDEAGGVATIKGPSDAVSVKRAATTYRGRWAIGYNLPC